MVEHRRVQRLVDADLQQRRVGEGVGRVVRARRVAHRDRRRRCPCPAGTTSFSPMVAQPVEVDRRCCSMAAFAASAATAASSAVRRGLPTQATKARRSMIWPLGGEGVAGAQAVDDRLRPQLAGRRCAPACSCAGTRRGRSPGSCGGRRDRSCRGCASRSWRRTTSCGPRPAARPTRRRSARRRRRCRRRWCRRRCRSGRRRCCCGAAGTRRGRPRRRGRAASPCRRRPSGATLLKLRRCSTLKPLLPFGLNGPARSRWAGT